MNTIIEEYESFPTGTFGHRIIDMSGRAADLLTLGFGPKHEAKDLLWRTAHLLRPGQVLKYQKASRQKVIVGWKIITTSSIATNYNFGDSLYTKKLDYVLTLIRKGQTALCAQ